MMKSIAFACLLIASSGAMANTAKHCGKLDRTDHVSAPMSIAEIEQQEMARLGDHLKFRSDYPKVPFGFINAEWVAFKSEFRPGDKIVMYSSDKQSWQHLAGDAGYALLRSGCVIKVFRTMWN